MAFGAFQMLCPIRVFSVVRGPLVRRFLGGPKKLREMVGGEGFEPPTHSV